MPRRRRASKSNFDGSPQASFRKLKNAPVDSDRADSFKVFYDLHGLIRVNVLPAHKPAWCVGADGNERKVGPAQLSAHLPKDLTIAIAGDSGSRRFPRPYA
jgi:hypothetical protein